MNSLLLHYSCLAEWNRYYRKDLLGTEHLESGQRHYTKFTRPDGREENVSFLGYLLEKDGIKYLIDFGDAKPKDVLPILVTDTEKVSFRNVVYERVKQGGYKVARFRSEKRLSPKQLVQSLCVLSHSNPRHQTLLVLMALSQYWGRANYRVCSNPGSGKDSSVQLLANLVGGCLSVTNPTLAKLEKKTDVSWLVINEMMRLGKAEWKLIEQFLLAAGDFKPGMEKHSLGYKGGKDSFDISNLSLSIFYNDVDNYPEDEFFDDRAHGAVKDRFPAFRVYGRYTERFDKIHGESVPSLVLENEDSYKDLIYSIIYYRDSMEEELHRYDTSLMDSLLNQLYQGKVSQRHRQNIGMLLKAVDLYCESQDEFNGWITVIAESLRDYKDMLRYTEIAEYASRKLGRNLWNELEKRLHQESTYTGKIRLIEEQLNPKSSAAKDVRVKW